MNQFPPSALRMRSMGLAQSLGGIVVNTSSILKSPLGASGTPARLVLYKVKEAAASQISVAKTLCPVALPTLLPPPKISPFPSTSISPFVFTSASRSLITQI